MEAENEEIIIATLVFATVGLFTACENVAVSENQETAQAETTSAEDVN